MKGIFIFPILLHVVSCFRILVYLPEMSRSHMRHMAKLADILAIDHDVTVLVSPFDPKEANEHGIKLAKIIRGKVNPHLAIHMPAEGKLERDKKSWTHDETSPISVYLMTKFANSLVAHCEGIMNNDELTAQIRREKFDIAIGEGFDSCIFGLYKQYGVKNHIVVSSGLFFSPHYELLGINYPSTQVPDLFADFGANGFSIYERAKNLYFGLVSHLFLTRPMNLEQDLFDKKFGKGVVDIRKTFSECAYYISNSDPLIDFAKPITSKVIEIGGFSIPKAKPLDEYYEKVMSLRKRNVLISFGSNAKSYLMHHSYKQNLKKVIKSFPDTTFIWKYEVDNDGISDGVDNLIISKWLPQTDILADKRLSGFITHGGLNSLTESSQVGVPLILIGLFGDQLRNAQVAEKVQFGKAVEKYSLSDYNIVRNAIDEVFFKSDKYRNAATKLMESIKNKPYNSTDVFIKHVVYAAKYGAQPMFNILGQDQSFIQRNNLDLLVIVVSVILLFIILIFKSIQFCCCKNKVTVSVSKKNK